MVLCLIHFEKEKKMCADGWYNREENIPEDQRMYCPECGEEVDSDGDAVQGCHYSPCECDTCGSRPCDGSC